jgi:hypothetical protein
MRRKSFIIQFYILVTIAALAGLTQQAAISEVQEGGIINRVLYNVRDDFSRLTFFVDGSVTCTAEQVGDEISLYFQNTTISRPPGHAQLEFKTGLIRKTTLEKINNRDAGVTINLRENGWYTIIRNTETDDFYVYIFPSNLVLHDPVPASIQLFDPISMAAGAAADRHAIDGNPAGPLLPTAHISEQPTSQVTRSHQHGPLILIFSVLSSAVIVTIMTACIIFIRYLRIKNKKEVNAGDLLPAMGQNVWAEKPESVETGFSTFNEKEGKQHPIPDSWNSAGRAKNEEDIAVKFRRGKGEIDLFMKMESDIKKNSLKKKLSGLRKNYASDSMIITDAKKLGIGRGEIKLLHDLEEFRANKIKKEVLS